VWVKILQMNSAAKKFKRRADDVDEKPLARKRREIAFEIVPSPRGADKRKHRFAGENIGGAARGRAKEKRHSPTRKLVIGIKERIKKGRRRKKNSIVSGCKTQTLRKRVTGCKRRKGVIVAD